MRKGASLYSKFPAQAVLVAKKLPASAGEIRLGFDPWVRKIPWRRRWHPTPVFFRVSQVAQWVLNLSAMQEMWIRFLGQEDPLEEGMATHSSILAWRIPRTGEPGGLQSIGLQRVGHDRSKWAGTLHKNELRSKSTFVSPAKSAWYQANTHYISYIVLYRNRFIILFIQIIYF